MYRVILLIAACIIAASLGIVKKAEAGSYLTLKAKIEMSQRAYANIKRAVAPFVLPVGKVISSGAINAYSNVDRIAITSQMLIVLSNEDEIALILGHEAAHRVLGHNEAPTSRMEAYTHEYAADKLGLEIAVRAGYNKCKAARAILVLNPFASIDHPDKYSRYKNIAYPDCK